MMVPNNSFDVSVYDLWTRPHMPNQNDRSFDQFSPLLSVSSRANNRISYQGVPVLRCTRYEAYWISWFDWPILSQTKAQSSESSTCSRYQAIRRPPARAITVRSHMLSPSTIIEGPIVSIETPIQDIELYGRHLNQDITTSLAASIEDPQLHQTADRST